jgi:hypothetical protein
VDTVLDRFIVGPVVRSARWLATFEAGTSGASGCDAAARQRLPKACKREAARGIDA